MTKRSQDSTNTSLEKMGESLPILPPKQPPITEPDWRKVQQPKPFMVRPPKGAPNVVLVLLDQVCYSDPSTFGGPISRSDFLTRIAVAWFGAINEKFKLFSPDIISSSFSKTDPPPIHTLEIDNSYELRDNSTIIIIINKR